MSDCQKFEDMFECIANEECSEEQKIQFYEHIENCNSCKEELEFTLNIRNTLRTLPEIEVPGDFLASLNKKLDIEDELRVRKRKNVFEGWRKYSALAACLLLTFLLKVDVWNLPDMSGSENVTVEVEKTIEISPEVVPENPVVPVVDEPSVAAEPVVEDTGNSVQDVVTSEEIKEVEEKQIQEINKPKKEEKKSKQEKASKVQNVQTAMPEKETLEPEQVQENKKSGNKVIVVKASTPHSSVEIPEGDEVIVVEKGAPKRVNFDDYKLVESPELMETFAISEGSEKNLIIATPAAMTAVSNISIDTSNAIKYDVPEANHGAGSGSFFVSVDDRHIVASILSKYSASENNQTFMLSSRSYKSFVKELQRQGIEYTDYMINTGKSNVAFKLMVT